MKTSRTNVRFVLCLTLICWIAAVVPAAAQHFQQIPTSLSQIAAGRNEVWGLHFPGGQIYRLIPGPDGANSADFLQIAGSLSQIAVGGGALLQPDEVWGVNGAGVFRFNLSTNAYVQKNPTGSATFFNQIAVGEGDSDSCHPYEVWGLASSVPASSGLPYRYNYCEGQFDQIPLPSGSTIPFTHIATGGSDVWALDADAHIWHFNQFTQAWRQITSGGYYGTLQQITVGVNDVWGLDGNGTVYRYDPNYVTFVSIEAGNFPAKQIAAGGDGVWAIGPEALGGVAILRFDSGPQGFQSFTPFNPPSPGAQIAVGSGAGVWVVNSSNQVYAWVRP